jgi:hypothetical protein
MEQKTVTLHLFMKNGGPQPETWDTEAINKFFIGNYAKQWAMCDGYMPTYLGYENGVIKFKLVTDPRITGIYWISLCNYIANQYKAQVNLLRDATNFEVDHYMANDIIGFNIEADDPEKLKEYDARLKASYATLPENPSLLHRGRIRKM